MMKRMKRAWQNELSTRVLLPHEMEMAACLNEQIENMDSNINRTRDKVTQRYDSI